MSYHGKMLDLYERILYLRGRIDEITQRLEPVLGPMELPEILTHPATPEHWGVSDAAQVLVSCEVRLQALLDHLSDRGANNP